MKKLLALVPLLASTAAWSGEVATNPALEPVLMTEAHMGGMNDWIIPLLALGMIALAMSQPEEEKCDE